MDQRARRALCRCGGRNTVRVIVEYARFGDDLICYAGGSFCYHSNALIDLEIPDGAIPIQAHIYDLHDPEEIIRITFRQSRHRRRMSPKDAVAPERQAIEQR